MGPSPSKPVIKYVYEVDTCRPPILELAMEHTMNAARRYESCAQKAASDMWMEMIQQNIRLNQANVNALRKSAEQMQARLMADDDFCFNIETKYKPFGIEGPVGLNCHEYGETFSRCKLSDPDEYDSSCEAGEELPTENIPRMKDENGDDVPNIVILGNTGVGKSFYGNGILGSENPDSGHFGTSGLDNSCTRGAKGVFGHFYGGMLSSYNVESMPMNVIDTPGFADSDPCQIEKNKQRIASSFDKPIHAFIFLMDHSNSRIDANDQVLFKMLNEWTMGNIWSNLVIGYPKMTFIHNDKMNRMDKKTSFYKELNVKKEQIQARLWKMAIEGSWKRRDKNNKMVPMRKSDFENIQVNALNVQQNNVCYFTNEGRIDTRNSDLQRCSQLAVLDESFDYVFADDSEITESWNNQNSNPFAYKGRHGRSTRSRKRSNKYRVYDDRYVFIEEARKLQRIIKDFSKHPVTTQKVYWQKQYEIERAAYIERYKNSEIQVDTSSFDNAGIDTRHCFKERRDAEQKIKKAKEEALKKCPT